MRWYGLYVIGPTYLLPCLHVLQMDILIDRQLTCVCWNRMTGHVTSFSVLLSWQLDVTQVKYLSTGTPYVPASTLAPSTGVKHPPRTTLLRRYHVRLYFAIGSPLLTPSKFSLPMGDLGSDLDTRLHVAPWAHLSPRPKRHLDRFSPFCMIHDRDSPTDRPTDRPTDHSTRSVTIGRNRLRYTKRMYTMGGAKNPGRSNAGQLSAP